MGFLYFFFTILSNILMIAIFGRVIMSWVDPGGQTFLSRLFYELTEPVLLPIRKIVPSMGMFDLSPLIALLLLQVLRQIVTTLG